MSIDLVSEQRGAAEATSVDTISHRDLRDDDFWRRIPAYSELSSREFNDHRFQSRNAITSPEKLRQVLDGSVPESFFADVEAGQKLSTMSIRVSPYIVSLIDWSEPYEDSLRRQFLPLASSALPDHPELEFDALHEQEDSPVTGLTHRYTDRALFLALDTCPVYCRFCTRSYSVGLDTDKVDKVHFGAQAERWEEVFQYLSNHQEIEDVVISGGDVANLRADHIELIGNRLLEIDNIRRMRFATMTPAILPQKLVTDDPWVDALIRVARRGRALHKEVALHTHFNHPVEITAITRTAVARLTEQGIAVRNQSVLQRGVNDSVATMQLLVKRLSFINVQPYYVFVHDMVRGVEDLRTTLQAALDLEKSVRGVTAGFNTPTFVLDTMGGGGKRDVYSYEHYDRERGIAVYTSPAVRPGNQFLFFDPIDTLTAEAQRYWQDSSMRTEMINAAIAAVDSGV